MAYFFLKNQVEYKDNHKIHFIGGFSAFYDRCYTFNNKIFVDVKEKPLNAGEDACVVIRYKKLFHMPPDIRIKDSVGVLNELLDTETSD